MAFSASVTSSSSNSSTSESSLFSSPCSSPTSSHLQHSPSQGESRVAVPFLWEETPGISKPCKTPTVPSSSSIKLHSTARHILYGTSLEFPSLPPPPRLSQAFLSQPRSRESKLLLAPSVSRRKPLADTISFKIKSSSKDDEEDDPFFLALKACTKESKSSRREKASFDGLQAALRGLFKPTKKEYRSKGGSTKECTEHDSYHPTSREVSPVSAINKSQLLLDERARKPGSGTDRMRAHMYMRRKDEAAGANQSVLWEATMYKSANSHADADGASRRRNLSQVGGATHKARQSEPLQATGKKASRRENLGGADESHSKPLVRAGAKDWQSNDSSVAAASGEACSKVLEPNCRGGTANPGKLTDLLGCKAVPPLINGAAIHPSLMFPKQLFSAHHS